LNDGATYNSEGAALGLETDAAADGAQGVEDGGGLGSCNETVSTLKENDRSKARFARSGLTSLAVQVQEVQDAGTTAHGDVVGDASSARAVKDSNVGSGLLGGRGNGQSGEKGDDGGVLHLEGVLICFFFGKEDCECGW
jgi:hypothetical protein